ncbi:MAG: sigma-70 family RNA polymerase sigma factor [Verrucomicrobiota bacterium]|nr:sigma-70 family RNA polymerase sigma factor [Verrucomicrobiota bacterium]
MSQPDQIHVTRSTLLGRLKDLDNQQAWQEFFDVYWTLLFNFARRAGLNEADAEEVVMETVETVARKIEDFEYNRQRGRFKGWLLTIVRFKLGDRFRKKKRQAQKREIASLDEVAEGQIIDTDSTELEKIWDAEWQKRMVDMALERVKQLAGHKQYQIFHCYVIQEQDPDEVAEFLEVSKSQVYVAKNRVGKIFEAELKLLASEEENA